MKLTIEVDLDAQHTAHGSVLKAMIKQLLRSIDQIPDWADARQILEQRPDEPFVIMAEAMNADRTRTEGRVVMQREAFNGKLYAMDQISRTGAEHVIEDHVLR